MQIMVKKNSSAKNQLKTELLKRLVSPGVIPTAIGGLLISRFHGMVGNEKCLFNPFIGFILQGKKKAVIGGKEYQYGEGDCIAVGMDTPAITEIVEASEDVPVLFVGIEFDRYLFTQFETDIPASPKAKGDFGQCAVVFKAPEELVEAFLRLVRLLDKPERITALAPLIIKEIHYLVLSEPHSRNLRLCSTPGTHNANIAETIAWLRKNYRNSLRIEDLACIANMSSPTFHRRFREVTSFSPIQFQKLMRLSEARRLLLSEGKNAAAAALEVGYESITQFNREYKQHFGEPPRRDAVRLLASGVAV
jgi:AraC-like DNA-binding protein